MKTSVKITNKSVYEKNVSDVNTDGLSSSDYLNGIYGDFIASGTIRIEEKNGDVVEYHGQHCCNEYKSEYGFILECEEE